MRSTRKSRSASGSSWVPLNSSSRTGGPDTSRTSAHATKQASTGAQSATGVARSRLNSDRACVADSDFPGRVPNLVRLVYTRSST